MNGNSTGKPAGLAWIADERAAGRPPDNAAVRRQFGVSERTARNWLGYAGNGSTKLPAAVPPATIVPANGNGNTPKPADGNDTLPSGRPGKRRRRRQRQPATGNTQRRWPALAADAVTGIGLLAVVGAPVAISARSLAAWGREALDLADGWDWLVPLPLDGAALACVGLALHATQRGEAPGFARILVWVMAGCSAVANWRHGTTISPDAALFFAGMPLLAALMLDLVLRRVRHTALSGLGALERPLARYRTARWLVAPSETWQAWRTAVREGITDPDEALQRAAAVGRVTAVTESQNASVAGDSAMTRHSSGAT